jgi:hypothetical protein
MEIRITGKYAHDHGYYEGETMNAAGEKISLQREVRHRMAKGEQAVENLS